jgi:pre-60S factor REI1
MRDVDDASSVMSSTFSLGEPLETASNVETASVASVATDRPEDRDADLSHIAESDQQSNIADDDNESRAPSNTTDADDDMVEVLLNQCLFCNTICEDVDENIKHMSKQHGMFVPEREFLVDLEGLLSYLHEKIHDDHQCLYCGQLKHTASGIQTHMRDRGHCMIPYSTEDEMLEIGEFYDFRSTYSDDDESTDGADDQQEGGVKLGAARATKVTIETEDGDGDAEMADEDDEGWESDGSLSSVPTDEITSVPIDDHSHRYKTLDQHKHHSHKDPRPHRNADGYHSHAHSTPHAVYHDEYELHLPSGRTAGHRSLAKYYRQNLRNYPTPEERADQRALEGRHDSDGEEEARNSRNNRGREIVTRGEGALGMVGVSEDKKKEVRAAEKREKKREQRLRANYQWGTDRAGNNQKHWRVSFDVRKIDGVSLISSRTISCNRCVRSILQPLAAGLLHFWTVLFGLSIPHDRHISGFQRIASAMIL